VKNTLLTVFFFKVILASSIPASAQKNFKAGKIVTLKGDTIVAKIEDKKHRVTPDSIAFIRQGNTKVEKHPPAKIKAAIIEGSDYFLSAKLKIDMFYSTKKNPFETYSRADKTVIKDLFLQVLLIGKLSLYQYVDENHKEHFFVKPENEDYRELIYKKVPIKSGGEPQVFEDMRYKEQLRALMADCNSLDKKIEWLHCTEKDLLELFNLYNNCIFSKPLYKSKPDKNKPKLHLFAGVDVTKFSFTGLDYFSHLENSSFAPCTTFLPGIRLIVPLQKKAKKAGLVLDLANRNISMSSQHAFTTSTYDVNIYMDYLKFTAGFRYKLRTPSVEPYFIGGLSLNYLVDFRSSKVQTSVDTVSGLTVTIHDRAIEEPQPFDFGFFAGLGFRLGRFNLEERFEKSTGFLPSGDLESHVTTINVLLSFRLSKEE
jgi:hypothetical protein